MENKKELSKKILFIIIILIIVISSFIFYKKENEEFVYFDEINTVKNIDEIQNSNSKEFILTENKVVEKNKIKIYITGEVNNPGVKELEEGARIEDAINIAGGLTDMANISQINLAYFLEDGEKIYIPNVNEEISEYITKDSGENIIEGANDKTNKRININKANINELCELPGVGEALARRIVAYREENGKFKSIEDLKNISGIGEKKFESLKNYIEVK